MDTITVYSPAELKEKNPEAYEKAFDSWSSNQGDDIPWMDETVESLKELFKAAGIHLTNWRIGPEGYRNSVEFSLDKDTYNLTDSKAKKWLENNLYSQFRITEVEAKEFQSKGYGKYYRKGLIKPCPFTGYCADDDLIDCLNENVKSGMCLGESLRDLARETGKLLENELEYITSEEYFLEQDIRLTESGRII